MGAGRGSVWNGCRVGWMTATPFCKVQVLILMHSINSCDRPDSQVGMLSWENQGLPVFR